MRGTQRVLFEPTDRGCRVTLVLEYDVKRQRPVMWLVDPLFIRRPMTDSLRRELPRMLEEHKTIRDATIRLGEVARAEGNAAVERLAEQLKLHAQSEEELFYPAALLVGELVRARTTREP